MTATMPRTDTVIEVRNLGVGLTMPVGDGNG